jgi:hypothetical protein
MSRKYRQQGYMDSDRNDRESRPRQPPNRNLTTEERIQRRSMRHAIDRDAREVIRCHVCGRSTQEFDIIRSDTECPHCQAPLHCCRTCLHFDSAALRQCRAEITEAVGDKSRANHCAEYAPRLVLDSTGRRSNTPRGAGGAREQFENLFKR